MSGLCCCRGPGEAASDVRTSDADAAEPADVARDPQLSAAAVRRPEADPYRRHHQQHPAQVPAVGAGPVSESVRARTHTRTNTHTHTLTHTH